MLKRDTAPAPVATISGTTPSTMAAVVIRIGRNRMPAARSIASRSRMAFLLQVVGELHDQDAVLADQPHQRDQADLGVDVQARAAEPKAHKEQGAGDRHRHRDQDDERVAETLEQRGERQIDDDQREAECEQEAADSCTYCRVSPP